MTTTRFLAPLLLAACATTAREPDDRSSHVGGKADDSTASIPWGGADPSKLSPEAILANAATSELRRDPTARVSIPAALWTSHYAPFGDGQTNAAASLVHWNEKRPPVVGVRTGGRTTVRFDRALPISDTVFELWTPSGTWVRSIASARTAEGDWLIDVGDAAEQFVVSPRGWRDGFPLSFALPVSSIDALVQTLPESHRTLPGGEPIVDPVGAAGDDAYATLMTTSFPHGFVNQTPFVDGGVHAAFPQSGAPRVTAVGGASTWVAEAPFKHLYVCFDERAPAREAEHGVPTGAGWHHIGDPGESIVSSLEDSALLVGYAPATQSTPPANGGFAYGLDRATTFAMLQPGEAFTTPKGAFHWYAVHQAQKPCVQIWVH